MVPVVASVIMVCRLMAIPLLGLREHRGELERRERRERQRGQRAQRSYGQLAAEADEVPNVCGRSMGERQRHPRADNAPGEARIVEGQTSSRAVGGSSRPRAAVAKCSKV